MVVSLCDWRLLGGRTSIDYGKLIERAGAILKCKDLAIVRGEGDKLEVTYLVPATRLGVCVFI